MKWLEDALLALFERLARVAAEDGHAVYRLIEFRDVPSVMSWRASVSERLHDDRTDRLAS